MVETSGDDPETRAEFECDRPMSAVVKFKHPPGFSEPSEPFGQPPGAVPADIAGRAQALELAVERLRAEMVILHSQIGNIDESAKAGRHEMRGMIRQLGQSVADINRHLDADRGRREALAESLARRDKERDRIGEWVRALLPFAAGVGLTALAMFIDGRVS